MIEVQHSNHSNMVRQGILPEPFPKMGGGYSVVSTTPYVIVEMAEDNRFPHSTEKKWMAFFERNLHKTNLKDPVAAYEWFMKYGLSRQQLNYRRPSNSRWSE